MPTVSIIICTCNRQDHLRETLRALEQLVVPEDITAEVLVVDNGSTDQTEQVVRSAAMPHIPVRYLWEERRGKGYAYNAGMAAAAGDVLLFTDDDVRPPRFWIDGMCRRILRGEADAVAGGVKVPQPLRRRWLLEGFPCYVACTEKMTPESMEILIGANMAFSRRVLEKVPAFDTELGPGALGFRDETLFAHQLVRAGYYIAPALDVAVEHHFDMSRLGAHNCIDIARKMGCSAAYVTYHWEHGGLWRWPWRSAARTTLALVYRRLFRAAEWKCEEAPPYWALELISAWAFVRQYMRERKRPRNYDRLGLVKLEK